MFSSVLFEPMPPEVPRSPSAPGVEQALSAAGLTGRVRQLPASTRTATDAANALGCEDRQVVKSLVFRTGGAPGAVIVLVSGNHRVDEQWMARYVGAPLSLADPEFARSVTGYVVGEIPPVGLGRAVPTYIDYELLELPEVWAAAGTPNAMVRLTSLELLTLSGGHAVPVVPYESAGEAGHRWVTFDCYGTLVDWRAGLLDALDQTLPASSPLALGPRERFFRTFLVEEQRLESGTYLPYREVMASALRAAAAVERIPLNQGSADAIVDSIPTWPLFPDTGLAVRELASRGVRLAVLSNIDRDLLEQTLSHHGLEITTCVTAQDVGSYKPSPPHWIRFLKQTGLDPERVWHVAGSYEYDITTACALGFRTVFVARYGGTGEGGCSDIEVTDLAEFARRLALPPERDAAPGAASGGRQDHRA